MMYFIYGVLVMSLISAVALVVNDSTDSDLSFFIAGGPFLWVIALFAWVYRKISNKLIFHGTKSVFADKAGQLWYCDRKWHDLITEFSDDYEQPDIMKYQDYTKFWRNRVSYGNGKYYGVNFRYSPKKFWKTLAKPIPQEKLWKLQEAKEISRH